MIILVTMQHLVTFVYEHRDICCLWNIRAVEAADPGIRRQLTPGQHDLTPAGALC